MKKLINKDLINLVIYHNPCPDGFTSAAIANLYFKDKDSKPEFWGVSHAQRAFPELEQKTKDKNVLICDFTFKKEIGLKLLEHAKTLQVIDHHVCSQNDSQNIPNPTSYDLATYKSLPEDLGDVEQHRLFDVKHCGASLTWNYFYPDIEVPLFVRYIEDNDIWIKGMPQTYEVTAYVTSIPYEFRVYEELIVNESLINDKVIPIGTILWKQIQKHVESSLNKSTIKMIELNGNVYFLAMCNSNTNINEIGNQMLTKYPYCDFSMVYTTNDTTTSISFRSDETRANVNQIATVLKGGGHRNASGASLYDKITPGHMIGDYHNYKQLRDVEFVLDRKVGEDEFSYAILNTSQNKTQFAKYLLQPRTSEFYDENNERKERIIQEACSCYRTQKVSPLFYERFDFAVTWNHGDEKTWFTLHWSDHKNYDIRGLFDKYNDYEINENKRMVKFSLLGLNMQIF